MPAKKPTKSTTATKPRTTTRRKKTTSVVDSVKDLQPDQVMNEVGALSVSLQSQLAGIGASISQKLEAMQDLNTVLATKGSELAELYEIEKDAQNLETVREMRADEDEAWDKKKSNRLAEWADDEAERTKRFQREGEAHAYDHAQTVARNEEQFGTAKAERQRGEAIRQEDLNRDWSTREEALKSQENEAGELRERVEQFEEEMKREVSKAEAQATQRVKREYEHQIQLLDKDFQAATSLSNSQQQALQAQISGLSEQLEDSQKQLGVALADAKEVTAQALQSASGRDSLAAVQTSLVNSGSKK